MVRYATATTECPAECRQWLEALAPDLHDRERIPSAVFTYLLDVSTLLPRLLRVVCEGSSAAALAAVPELLRAVEAVEASFPQHRAVDPVTVYLCSIYRGVRVKLHHCLLLLVVFAGTVPTLPAASRRALREQREASLAVIETEVQRILDSVEVIAPSAGGSAAGVAGSWMDALRVLWPLSVVARVATVPKSQREAAVGALRRIKRETGFQRVAPERVVPARMEPFVVPVEVEGVSGRESTLVGLLGG